MNKSRKKLISILAVCFTAMLFYINFLHKVAYTDILNVYGWYGVLPRDIFDKFETETGIKIIYDVYDNNDTLEAKLLATNSGYDIVFPSLIPYAGRQNSMGIYSKLDFSLIPNIKNLGYHITKKMEAIDANYSNYLIPLFWGTIGIAYEENTIKKTLGISELNSYDYILKEEYLQKLTHYGISFPEEYVDIFPQTKVFLNINPADSFSQYCDSIFSHFKKIRKYISKFSSNTMISDLLSADVCVAIGSSDNAWRASQSAPKGKKIKYSIPEKQGVLWIDCVCIPQRAPHKENAHKFINFLLRPEIAARITNFSGMLVNIPQSTPLIDSKLRANNQIFPKDSKVLNELILGNSSKSLKELQEDKLANRTWLKIRMNNFIKD